MGLRANVALRAMTGFLTIFMLFLVRDEPLGALTPAQSVGALGAAAVLGSLVGSLLGNRFRRLAPEPIIVSVLVLAAVTSLLTAMFYGIVTALVVAAVAALGQQLGKLAMDAQIQRDVPERVRTSAFARTETAVQLAWVLGGGLGIALPLNPGPRLHDRRSRTTRDLNRDRAELRRARPRGADQPPAPHAR